MNLLVQIRLQFSYISSLIKFKGCWDLLQNVRMPNKNNCFYEEVLNIQ